MRRAASGRRRSQRCELANHPYLASKGFPDARALVDVGMAQCSFRCATAGAGKLLACRRLPLIDNEWTKKMLPGMRARAPCVPD